MSISKAEIMCFYLKEKKLNRDDCISILKKHHNGFNIMEDEYILVFSPFHGKSYYIEFNNDSVIENITLYDPTTENKCIFRPLLSLKVMEEYIDDKEISVSFTLKDTTAGFIKIKKQEIKGVINSIDKFKCDLLICMNKNK